MLNKLNGIFGRFFLSPNDLYGILFSALQIYCFPTLFLWVFCVYKCVCLSICIFFFVLGCKLYFTLQFIALEVPVPCNEEVQPFTMRGNIGDQ